MMTNKGKYMSLIAPMALNMAMPIHKFSIWHRIGISEAVRLENTRNENNQPSSLDSVSLVPRYTEETETGSNPYDDKYHITRG